ncbi:cation:proton antiporter [Streptomyces sp. NPDC058195]|uniref:cation:proton antiporter domain-containing protein n=1 Tax=Streptomyces sp. NPDC058195 TaxID=3346375 RepID=UPI0036ED99E5
MAGLEALPLDAIVLADVALVLVAGAVMVRLARRLRQPPVVAEITVGVMLGPSLLGLLPGNLTEVIFPPQARPVLGIVAQIGLVLFMFLAGWELDLRRLRSRGTALGTMAMAAMAVPFVLGLGAAAVIYGALGSGGTDRTAFMLFLATAFSITAFPVLARIIKDRGLASTRVGALALTCAAIGDVTAWCVLVLVVALAGSGGVLDFVTVVALTAVFGAVMGLVVRPLLASVLRKVSGPTQWVLISAGVFLTSVATTWIGIHAIFGAFAFGLVMPRHGPQWQTVSAPMERTTALLLPVYFVVTGLAVDINGLGAAGLSVLALVVAVAVIGKFAGASLPARLWGMPWREACAFGALMNTRGLTEIVILGIGHDLGLIGPELFTVMVLMALITTAMAGPVLHKLGMDQAGPPHPPPVRPARDEEPVLSR